MNTKFCNKLDWKADMLCVVSCIKPHIESLIYIFALQENIYQLFALVQKNKLCPI